LTLEESLVELDWLLSQGVTEIVSNDPVLRVTALVHGIPVRSQVEDWDCKGRGDGLGRGLGEGWGLGEWRADQHAEILNWMRISLQNEVDLEILGMLERAGIQLERRARDT